MSVLDIGTGRGYTAELLAHAVGPGGSIVGQNDTFISEKYLKNQPDPRFGTAIPKTRATRVFAKRPVRSTSSC